MTTTLHQLPSFHHRRRRRVGRGAGSGRGTYAGRGLKGQRSRSGGRAGLKVRGIKQFIQQIPKKRGFTSPYPKFSVVPLSDLERFFEQGDKVTEKAIIEKGSASKNGKGIKILGSGTLTKKLDVEVSAFSESAKNAILSAGGSARIRPKKKRSERKFRQEKQRTRSAKTKHIESKKVLTP